MKNARMSEEEADDVLDFISQKSGLFDKIIVNHVGSICSSKTIKTYI